MVESRKFDYEKIGFKSGLEIHQQLDTNKLFCNCPSILRSDEPAFRVERKLHAVAGESGEIDVAVKHEVEKEKKFIYEAYDSTCLVELDEMPPYEINSEALKTALQVAIFLNATIFPITQIMRKIVVDGSNTSGFQRTVLIARDGWVITKSGRVGIQSICLEEDSARIVRKEKGESVYRLDRLGIPLIEIATEPDMISPEQVKEVALYLGKILRSCKVKRGIGTIRQDLNLSIKGGERVEIKGFQDPSMMVATLNNEIQRQIDILSRNQFVHSEVRNALSDGRTEFLRPMPGASRMYPETDLPLLKISRNLINEVKKTLPKLREEIEEELKTKGLSQEMIKLLFQQNKIEEFKELVGIYNEPNFIAKMLLVFPREIASHEKKSIGEVEEILNRDVFIFISELLCRGEISDGKIKIILERIVKGEDVKKAVVFDKEENLEEEILKLIKSKPGLSENAYMGLVMKQLHGKVDGKTAIELIRKMVGK